MLRRALLATLLGPTLLGSALGLAPSASLAATPTCQGLPATIVGTTGDDRLVGTAKADVILARGGDDRVEGRGGDDVICGGPGTDRLLGGAGEDRIDSGKPGTERRGHRTFVYGDELAGGSGDDWLRLRAAYGSTRRLGSLTTLSFAESRHPVQVDLAAGTATGEGDDTIVTTGRIQVDGSRYDDELLGSERADVLDGRGGDDTLAGGAGRDALLSYQGDDRLDGGTGADMLISTRGSDTLDGGDGRDWLIAGSRWPTTMLGGDGFDVLSRQIRSGPTGPIDGGAGGNQLELDPQLWFDGPRLEIAVDRATQTAVLRSGEREQTVEFADVAAFTLWGDARWSFTGTDEDDFLQVLDGSVEAHTLGGDDQMIGGERADLLDGGDGVDAAWGGGGHNTCLDTEEGDCDAYPWSDSARRGAPAAPDPVAWVTGRVDVPQRPARP